MGGKTNRDDVATGTGIFHSLLEGLLGNGEEKDGVRTQIVGSSSPDIGNQVLGFGEVNVSLAGTQPSALPWIW